MKVAPWIFFYEQREWAVYKVVLGSPEDQDLYVSLKRLSDQELFVCGAESEAAANHWKIHHSVEGVLFYDIEQLWAMELDKVYGVSTVGILTAEWNGHPSGSLVMSVYKGITENPRCITVGVAIKR